MVARIRSSLAVLALMALVACAAAPSSGPARITQVSAMAGSGYVTVSWSVAGVPGRFEVARAEAGDGGMPVGPLDTIASIEDGSVRSFDDVHVDPGSSYVYAVSVDGGSPVGSAGEGVRPGRGNRLQILFGGPVPEGASVRSEPTGIACAAAGAPGCTAEFAAILDVTLTVDASDDVAVSWVDCDNASGGACTVSMEEPRTVSVSVQPAIRTLTVAVVAPGTGHVSNANDLGSAPLVDCSATCTYDYQNGLQIGLVAEPISREDHRFTSWGGACAATEGPACTVTMDESKSVRANFELIPPDIAFFDADPDRIRRGEAATLSWNVSGGGDLRVSIEPDVGDVTGRTEVDVSPDETTVYTLTVSNDAGTVSAAVRVLVRSWPFGSAQPDTEAP